MGALGAAVEQTADSVAESELATRGTRSRRLSDSEARSLSVAALAVLGAMTLILIAFIDRGLALADQSLFLVMTDEPELSRRSASGYHFLLHPLFELVGKSIVPFRFLRAAIDIATDVVFGAALVSYLRARNPLSKLHGTLEASGLVAGITIVGFVSWSWSANGFGYNELGSIFAMLIAATLLMIVRDAGRLERSTFAFAGILGALLVGFAIVRWTGAVLVLFGCTVIVLNTHGFRNSLRLALRTLLGATVAAVIVHWGISDLGELVSGIQSGMVDIRRGAHSIDFILGRYATSVKNGSALGVLSVAAISLVALVATRWQSGRARSLSVALAAALAMGWAFAADRPITGNRSWSINATSFSLAVVSLFLLCVHVVKIHKQSGLRAGLDSMLMPAMFLAIPIAVFAGTDVFIFIHLILLAPLWIAAIVMILSSNSIGSGRIRSLGYASIFVLGGACALFGVEVLLHLDSLAPRDESALIEQGRLEGLVVGEDKHLLFSELESIRTDLRPNPTVISLWNRPAVVYALGGHGIGFPWYSPNGIESAVATVEGACREDGFVPASDVVLVLQEVESEQFGRLDRALEACGIDFPADFDHVTSLVAPGHQIVDRVPLEILDLEVYVSSR